MSFWILILDCNTSLRKIHGLFLSPWRRRTLSIGPCGLRNVSSRSSEVSTRYTITSCPPTDTETLRTIVEKHVRSLDRFLQAKPVAAHTLRAFRQVHDAVPVDTPIILDSGCGTGRSSLHLGRLYPDAVVLGIDRSVARLSKNPNFQSSVASDDGPSDDALLVRQAADNVWLVRAELVDFWRCCIDAGWESSIAQHFVLYPNPYPKKSRIKSRLYAHPGFPLLLRLGGDRLTVRSNWRTYLDEFSAAVHTAAACLSTTPDDGDTRDEVDGKTGVYGKNYAQRYLASTQEEAKLLDLTLIPWTNFEEKYHNVGERTYELVLKPISK